MRKRITVPMISALLLTLSARIKAQQSNKDCRIDFRFTPSADDSRPDETLRALCQLGYFEGRNLLLIKSVKANPLIQLKLNWRF